MKTSVGRARSVEPGDDSSDGVQWLKVILASVTLVALALIYILWRPAQDNMLGQLIINAIPSAIVVLIAVPIVYFVFSRKGLERTEAIDEEQLAERIAQRLASPGKHSPIIAFHDTYRSVDWKHWLERAHSRVDIVVFYFDSWVNQNYDALHTYFQKPGTKMRVIVSNPNIPEILQRVNKFFPDYEDGVYEKIVKTRERFLEVLRDAGADASRLEIHYAPRLLSYSAQCLDDEVLVLSVFEMYRKNRIDSPAVILDLTKSTQLAKFWHKELDGLLKESELQATPH